MKISIFVFVLLIPGCVLALTPQEKQIAETAKKDAPEAVQFLERVVNINSGTLNTEGVRATGEIFSKEFQSIGFQTKWISMPAEMHRAGHLFAEKKGTSGKRLLLIGHLDTVFEKDSPFQPFTRADDRAKGQGANDMKGGDTVILYALKALAKNDALKNATITVALLGDEEKPGDPVSISRGPLIEAAKQSDVALGFETASSMDTATIARRGVSTWKLEASASQAHSSGIFSEEDGSGAVFEAARILTEFHQKLRGEQFLTFNPAVIAGGTEVSYDPETSRGTTFGKTNVIARTAIVEGDLRFISKEQKDHAQARMREIVEQHYPKTSAKIVFQDEYPSMPPTEGNKKLLHILSGVSEDLGFGKVEAYDPGARGAADISFVASYVDGLDGLGAMGNGSHSPEEDVDLSTFPLLIQRTAILIYRLTH